MGDQRIPLPDGYEPTAFTPEGSRAKLYVGVDRPMDLANGEPPETSRLLGDVLQFDHPDGSGNHPHMGLRNMVKIEVDVAPAIEAMGAAEEAFLDHYTVHLYHDDLCEPEADVFV